MNTPYVKQYGEDGLLVNPINVNEGYHHKHPNRRQRRIKRERFHGESKNYHLTVLRSSKYRRVRQVIKGDNGIKKTIEHYLPA